MTLYDSALFPMSEAYDDDPVTPAQDRPTPADIVATLGPLDRARRVRHLTSQAHSILSEGLALTSKSTVARCVLLSGGQDSTTVAHLFRRTATHLVHVNTGTGIPATTDFVRTTAAAWDLPLIEVHPPETYEDLVLGRVKTRAGDDVWAGGFPGPGAHDVMYQRLKERALDLARHELGVANSRTRQAVWITGRRRQESDRRASIPRHEVDGTVVWVSPVVNWTKLDLNTYRELHDVPVNPVTEHLHMSGECLCGSFAKPGELDEIEFFFPETAEKLRSLEEAARAAGVPEPWCRWGHGAGGSPKKRSVGRLCSSCEALWGGAA